MEKFVKEAIRNIPKVKKYFYHLTSTLTYNVVFFDFQKHGLTCNIPNSNRT